MNTPITFTLIVLSLGLPAGADGAEKHGPIHRITMAECEGTLRLWQSQHPQWVTLESRGLAGQIPPVFLLRITHRNTPDAAFTGFATAK
ncbi:MAG: hypothetical protein ABI318_04605 [Chthoniobacteraceae bacterium]